MKSKHNYEHYETFRVFFDDIDHPYYDYKQNLYNFYIHKKPMIKSHLLTAASACVINLSTLFSLLIKLK